MTYSSFVKVLVKIFAFGFYRVHAGLLLFLFVTFMIYGLFITPLNQTHLTQEQITFYNLMIVLTLISSPVMVFFVFGMWLFYTIKSWKYVLGQIKVASNHFLFYSVNAMDKSGQFKAWFMVQLVISLPMLFYAIYALVIGLFFGYYIIPAMITLYLLLLIVVSSWVYTKCINAPIDGGGRSLLSIVVRRWKKPFFSLFLYHIFDKLKIMLTVTKGFSIVVMLASYQLSGSVDNKFHLMGLMVLGLAVSHALLIYQSCHFERLYLNFVLNFPFERGKVYLNWAVSYLVLTLPESIWLLSSFDLPVAITGLVFHIAIAMLFRSLLYIVALDMRRFIYWVFYLFVSFFMMIQSGMVWVVIPLVLLASVFLFYRNYYKQKPLIKP